MKSLATFIGFCFLGIVAIGAILGLTWVIQGNDFFIYKYYAPKEESVRRQTFEQSKAYNEGMAQELSSWKLSYQQQTNPLIKRGMGDDIIHKYAGYDESKLPPDLAAFLDQLKLDASTPYIPPAPTTTP